MSILCVMEAVPVIIQRDTSSHAIVFVYLWCVFYNDHNIDATCGEGDVVVVRLPSWSPVSAKWNSNWGCRFDLGLIGLTWLKVAAGSFLVSVMTAWMRGWLPRSVTALRFWTTAALGATPITWTAQYNPSLIKMTNAVVTGMRGLVTATAEWHKQEWP